MFSSLCLAFSFFFFFPHHEKDHTEVEFVRVWPQWHDAAEFKRISEYFSGKENDSGWKFRRTHPDHREGFYFLARVKHKHYSLLGAKFVLRVILPDSPDPKPPMEFPADVDKGEDVFEIGITGPDWPNKKLHPVAWRLDLVGPDGHLLAWSQSFLWEKPGAVRP